MNEALLRALLRAVLRALLRALLRAWLLIFETQPFAISRVLVVTWVSDRHIQCVGGTNGYVCMYVEKKTMWVAFRFAAGPVWRAGQAW